MRKIYSIFLILAFGLQLLANDEPYYHSRRILNLPITIQEQSFSCGPASLLSVLRYFKSYTGNEAGLYNLAGTTETDGTSPNGLAAAAEKLGYISKVRENLKWDDLNQLLREEKLVILDIEAWVDNNPPNWNWATDWEDGHWVVLAGIDNENVYLMDPSLSEDKKHLVYGYIPKHEFLTRWHDYEIINGKRREYNNSAVVMWPKHSRFFTKTLVHSFQPIH